MYVQCQLSTCGWAEGQGMLAREHLWNIFILKMKNLGGNIPGLHRLIGQAYDFYFHVLSVVHVHSGFFAFTHQCGN